MLCQMALLAKRAGLGNHNFPLSARQEKGRVISSFSPVDSLYSIVVPSFPWRRLRALLGRLAAAARRLGGVFEPPWGVLIRLAAAARHLGGVFGPSWALGGVFEPYWAVLRRPQDLLEAFLGRLGPS